MDTMKSLNTSLPRSNSSAQPPIRPSEELLQSFKNAALSVTNLYRAAEVSERRGVQVGYQAALDELLAFLDKENIGLGDGEGWRIRQWATARLDDHPSPQPASDSEDDKAETTRQTNHDRQVETQAQISEDEMPLAEPQPSPDADNGQTLPQTVPTPENTSAVFTFRSSRQLTAESDSSVQANANSPSPAPQSNSTSQPTTAVTVNLHSRPSKSLRNTRQMPRSSALRSLGSGAGSKRRAPFAEYFDFPDLGSMKKSKFN